MGTLTRKASGDETLTLADCPCCGGDVDVQDCGYSSFNPASADCRGDCRRRWSFADVLDTWDAGKRWNNLASKIRLRLRAFATLKIDGKGTADRKEARRLLAELEVTIIGADYLKT